VIVVCNYKYITLYYINCPIYFWL